VIGKERMYAAVSPSPDGRYFLVAYLVSASWHEEWKGALGFIHACAHGWHL
jgi:hypothetical protein